MLGNSRYAAITIGIEFPHLLCYGSTVTFENSTPVLASRLNVDCIY